MTRSRGPPKLPAKQLAILAICRFAEPVTLTSIFPYLPEMIESFGIDKDNVAKWAGLTSAIYSLSQCLTAVVWGRASDTFGRKPTILIGLTCTMIFTLLWGVSTSLPMAIVVRALSGTCNGNVGIIRTMVAEMVPEKELQPRAFSIMPLVWSLGSIFGPSFGGFFAKPTENMEPIFGGSKFLAKYPFALPNIVASVLFAFGISFGFLFLKETLESRRHKTDYGLLLGKKLNKAFKSILRLQRPRKPFHPIEDEASASLLRPTSSSSTHSQPNLASKPKKPAGPRITVRDVFNRQSVINLITYTFLALHAVAYDQLLPIFLHNPPQKPNESNTKLPFKFGGGFGFKSGQIGTLFTLYGIVGCFIQFLVFPPVARKFGVLNCFKGCGIAFPFVWIITPFTALIQGPKIRTVSIFSILILKCIAGIFAFPCSIILLTNSAISLSHLGTLNGVAVSVSAVGRAIGPALGGAVFTWGLTHGTVVPSFFLLGTIAAIGAIPIWWLEEGEGFGSVSTDDSEVEDDDEEALLPVLDEAYESGEEAGGSRDKNKNRMLAGDEIIGVGDEEEALDVIDGPPLAKIRSKSSHTGEERRERRISSPIGVREIVGPGGGRRLSNGLAASNLGQGTGGTSFV